jgi:hypothetical protein
MNGSQIGKLYGDIADSDLSDIEPIPLHQIRGLTANAILPVNHAVITDEFASLTRAASVLMPSFRAPIPYSASFLPLPQNLPVSIPNTRTSPQSTLPSTSTSHSSSSSSPSTTSSHDQAPANRPQDFDSLDLEPRTVQEMMMQPNTAHLVSTIYSLWPSLTNTQQMVMEYSMPFSLTACFYLFNATSLAVAIGTIMAFLHTIEVLSTNFFGADGYYAPSSVQQVSQSSSSSAITSFRNFRPFLNPVEHLLIDNLWMQAIFSLFFWFPTQLGGPNGTSLAIGFVLTVPMNITISLKTHLVRQMQRQQHLHHYDAQMRYRHQLCQNCMGTLIGSCLGCYMAVVVLLNYYASHPPSGGRNQSGTVAYHPAIVAESTSAQSPWTSSGGLAVTIFFMNTLPTIFGMQYMNIWTTLVATIPDSQKVKAA